MIDCREIVEEYGDMVYRIALAQVKNSADAEDIYQEVFISLIRNIDKIEGELHLKHWLIRTTLNKCKNHFKLFWNRKVDKTDTFDYNQSYEYELNEIRELVQSLPSKYKDVVFLHYYEGYNVKEIAQILNTKEGTVKSRLFKARNLLKVEIVKGELYEL